MGGFKLYLLVILALISGFLIGWSIKYPFDNNIESPESGFSIQDSNSNNQYLLESSFIPESKESPKDRIVETDIKLYNQRVMINIKDAIIAKFTDTKSMEPVITKDSNAIEIVPKDINDIGVGDIISYKSAFSDGIIIHRVVEKRIDEEGLYLRAKGDNLEYNDPEKIRFSQVRRVVVGILY
jgi:hypothetical protein